MLQQSGSDRDVRTEIKTHNIKRVNPAPMRTGRSLVQGSDELNRPLIQDQACEDLRAVGVW
jgi:hypothetical protein